MWVFSTRGFYSVVEDRTDKNYFIVRARKIEHLENLENLEVLKGLKTVITPSPQADYAYRMRVPKRVWFKVVETLNKEINYDNFKDAVEKLSSEDRDYIVALHEVWQIMYEMQWRSMHPIKRRRK